MSEVELYQCEKQNLTLPLFQDAAMAKVGYKISDVKKILIGHLHLDHGE